DPRHSLGRDTTVWAFTTTGKKFRHIGNLTQRGDLEVSLTHDLRTVHVLQLNLDLRHGRQDIFLTELKLTLNCRQGTRIYLSSSADVSPGPFPPGYVPIREQVPRTEKTVLISF
ncbi:hypothetical protein EGW08_008363, partial [Elysia chlorotica]